MDSAHQFGDLATQLLTESRRSTATNTLLKYNDVLVRSIIREQRDLEAAIEAALAHSADRDPAADPYADPDATLGDRQRGENPYMPTILLYQTAILRNKRCLLAYHHHRIEFLKDLYWSVGGALPLLLSAPTTAAATTTTANTAGDLRSRLSPHEVDFLRAYNDSLVDFPSAVLETGELDLFAQIAKPPKDLHVLVRVVRDCGVVHTEQGAIDFRRGHRFLVRRADVEHLIVQGFLEEV